LEVRQAARADLEAARAERKTFKDAAAGWRELINKKPRAEKTRDRDERMISYLTGAFGNKPIDEVEAKDLIDLLETFEDNESYETRARLQATALNIGGYAQGKAWIKHNPFLGIAYGKAFTSPTNQPRPAITEAEPLGQLLRDVAAYSGRRGNLVRKALDLLALTFVRPGTVTQAEWDEFDLDGALWTIPFKKLKQAAAKCGEYRRRLVESARDANAQIDAQQIVERQANYAIVECPSDWLSQASMKRAASTPTASPSM
jgi:integrase